MPTDDKVYAACPVCKKQVLTMLASAGLPFLVRHNGKGQRKQCEGSFHAVAAPTPKPCQTPGCWGEQAEDSIHCPDCRDFYRGRGLTLGKSAPDA